LLQPFRAGRLAPVSEADPELQGLLAERAGCALHQLGYFYNWGLGFRMLPQLCVQALGPTLALIALCLFRHAPPFDYESCLHQRSGANAINNYASPPTSDNKFCSLFAAP
jgi:hypothetical protein